MAKKYVIKIEKRLEEEFNLSSLKLKDNELLFIEDEMDEFKRKLYYKIDEKFNGDKSDIIIIEVLDHKVGLFTDNLLRIIENTLFEVDHNASMKEFIEKLLRAFNNRDSSFISFIKYSPYLQNGGDIRLLFDTYDIGGFMNEGNLIVYGDRIPLTSVTLSEFYNITYTNLTNNSKKGFLFYKDKLLWKENFPYFKD